MVVAVVHSACATAYEFRVELTITAQQNVMFIRVDKLEDCCASGMMGGAIGMSQTQTKLRKMQSWFAQYTLQFIKMNGAGLANVPRDVQLVA